MFYLGKLVGFLKELFCSPQPPAPPVADDFSEALLYYHNEIREAQKISPLNLSAKLAAAAQKHAVWMDRNKSLRHNGDGNPGERIRSEGYAWSLYGENIAWGQDAPEQVFLSWMRSRGHKANILGRHYKDVGFGKTDKYWCAVFASPR